MATSFILLDSADPRYVRRLARAINSECTTDGFYSAFGSDSGTNRKFHGAVKVIKGRLMAREVGRWCEGWSVDLTGVLEVQGNGVGAVYASRRFPLKSCELANAS